MANVDRTNGFRVVGSRSGSPYSGATMACFSTDNLFKGDLVKAAATGTVSGDGAYMDVDRCTATSDAIFGVVVGWEGLPTNLSANYYIGGGTNKVFIVRADDVLLEAQFDDNTMDAVDVGLNVDATFTAGTTATGSSNMELSGSSLATTAAQQFKVIQVKNFPGNTVGSNWTRAIVSINQSQWADQSAGV